MYRLTLKSLIMVIIMVVVCAATSTAAYTNPVPVFGIVTLPCTGAFRKLGCRSQYINSDYPKWLESAGAKSIAIPYNADPRELEDLFSKVNGIVFTGGNHDLDNPYLKRTYQTLYKLAKQSTDNGVPMPIWGTCLGFEALALLATGYDRRILSTYDSSYVSLPVTWSEDAASAQFFDYLTDAGKKEIMDFLGTQPSTVNIHRYGIHPRTYERLKGLQDMYRVVGTSLDLNGKPFITMFEGKKYPFLATQYHPERVAYEVNPKENMLQNYANIRAMNHFASVIVEKARANMDKHAFPSQAELMKKLLLNRPLTYTGVKFPDNDLQFYLF